MMNGRCRQALFLLSVLPLTVVVPTLKAQTSLEHEINAYLEPYVRTGSFSGVVLVARDHEVLYRHGYGIADVETGAPNQPSTRFQIASVAKSFTAAAILVLQEAGALSIDDRIDIFLPEAVGVRARNHGSLQQWQLHLAGSDRRGRFGSAVWRVPAGISFESLRPLEYGLQS
jgi:CubicO group peptidase (beta-lactamase class C family)